MIYPIDRINDEQLIYNLNIENNMYRGTLIEVHLADLHFGVIDPKSQYEILHEQFTNKIATLKFDILSINGDIFDHKFMSNSDAVMYATMFINELAMLCVNNNATFVIIGGTESHDANQLKLFYHYINYPNLDIRIVETVRFEYIKGAKILCIPELYGQGKEYYNEFLNSCFYDSVFMHGMFKGAVYGANSSDLDSNKAPTFSIEDFHMCRGPIIAGHVHIPGCFNKYFYYCGSPLRFRFGEEQEKGFLILLHNLDTHQHYVHLEPIKSFRYDTINVDSMLADDPKNVISYINNLQAQGIDYIRLDLNNDYSDIEVSNIELIKKYYRNNSNIKIHHENNKKREMMKINKDILEENKEYEFILDKNLSEEDILCRYINIKKGYTYITCEELKNILSEDL